MPFLYIAGTGQSLGGDITTSATPNTETDDAFVRLSGTSVRTHYLQSVYVGGKSAGLTVISGISFRVKKWNTTASSGTLLTINAKDPGQTGASLALLQFSASSAGAITSGTGGPTYIGGFTCGATGPGGWLGPNANSYIDTPFIAGGSTQSIDIFSASGTPSLKYELNLEVGQN